MPAEDYSLHDTLLSVLKSDDGADFLFYGNDITPEDGEKPRALDSLVCGLERLHCCFDHPFSSVFDLCLVAPEKIDDAGNRTDCKTADDDSLHVPGQAEDLYRYHRDAREKQGVDDDMRRNRERRPHEDRADELAQIVAVHFSLEFDRASLPLLA